LPSLNSGRWKDGKSLSVNLARDLFDLLRICDVHYDGELREAKQRAFVTNERSDDDGAKDTHSSTFKLP
jgi:hypothetical protein